MPKNRRIQQRERIRRKRWDWRRAEFMDEYGEKDPYPGPDRRNYFQNLDLTPWNVSKKIREGDKAGNGVQYR